MSSSLKRIYGVGVAALVAMVVAFYFLSWRPTASTIRQVKAQDATTVAQAATLRSEIAQLRAAAANIGPMKAELGRIDQAVPSKPSLAPFILQVDAAATASGFQFLGISPAHPQAAATGAAGSKPTPPVVTVSLTGKGSFFQTLDFIHRLQSLPRIFVIDKLSVTPGGAGAASTSAAPDLTVSMAGRMFTTQAPSTTTNNMINAPASGAASTSSGTQGAAG